MSSFNRPAAVPLGHLESEVMEILWTSGENSVRDVVTKLARPLAHTTVETTLVRLLKKGLLARRKADRAFVYSARVSSEEWERQRVEKLVAEFFTGPKQLSELLISCLIDKAERDASLFDALERKIRLKRAEIESKMTNAEYPAALECPIHDELMRQIEEAHRAFHEGHPEFLKPSESGASSALLSHEVHRKSLEAYERIDELIKALQKHWLECERCSLADYGKTAIARGSKRLREIRRFYS